MHRLMLTSRAYQMASIDIAGQRRDRSREPDVLARAARAARGRDHSRQHPGGGRARSIGRSAGRRSSPTSIPISSKKARSATWPGRPDDDPSTWRRSIYVYLKRSIRYPMFETFDQPNLVNSADRRNRTIDRAAGAHPDEQRDGPGSRRRSSPSGSSARPARTPAEAGRSRVPARARAAARRDRAARGRSSSSTRVPTGCAEFCHALFNLNEFVYRQ